ncbi:hypothetical protein GDO81_009180 [Engystomops pustulosus]|uniref:EGF-like domain-containing protein n=1 Tax=Engystomops pustulosus TaxID=76066 RepID=A0AAV7BPK8_ENGPU|nr:hypothetical protein GDO81_009180 [Engystomops pustulosus]
MDRKFSRHFLLLIFGLTIVTITQQDPPQCLQENKPLTDEKKCPNNWICPSKGDCSKRNLCRCSNGYYKCRKNNVIICKDENECKISKHLCGNSSHCVNTQGGYYCKCDSHHRNGNQTEFCPSVDKEKNKCQEIDECRDNPGICGSNFICHNTNSSYGFRNISNTCVDIDECTDIPAICGYNSTCHNTAGSYYCSCDSGFKNKSNTCVDVDECSDFPGICGPNLVCHNTEGLYNCTCKDGLGNIPQSCTHGSSSGKTNTKNEACAVLKLTSNILDSVCHLNYTLTEKEGVEPRTAVEGDDVSRQNGSIVVSVIDQSLAAKQQSWNVLVGMVPRSLHMQARLMSSGCILAGRTARYRVVRGKNSCLDKSGRQTCSISQSKAAAGQRSQIMARAECHGILRQGSGTSFRCEARSVIGSGLQDVVGSSHTDADLKS